MKNLLMSLAIFALSVSPAFGQSQSNPNAEVKSEKAIEETQTEPKAKKGVKEKDAEATKAEDPEGLSHTEEQPEQKN